PDTIKAELPVLAFRSSSDWDAWLADQPRDSLGLWLKLAKKGSGVDSVSQQDAIDAAVCHGWIDGQLDKFDMDHWLVRFTPRNPKGRWSAKNRARAERMIRSEERRVGKEGRRRRGPQKGKREQRERED